MVRLTALLNWNGYHNIPKKYIQRKMFKGVVYENNHYMTPTVVYDYNKDWVYDENAPWTTAAADKNDPSSNRNKQVQVVLPLKDWTFYRGDRVEVTCGKDAGKQGIINGIVKQRNWVFVEGLNCKLEGFTMGKNASDLTFQAREKPLVVHRDVKLVDPSDLKPCEVVYRYTEEGEKVRVSKRTGQVIPVPPDAEATIDYVKPSAYKPGEKDMSPDELKEVSFEAKYKTFEQDLMDAYDIKETKERAETYVY